MRVRGLGSFQPILTFLTTFIYPFLGLLFFVQICYKYVMFTRKVFEEIDNFVIFNRDLNFSPKMVNNLSSILFAIGGVCYLVLLPAARIPYLTGPVIIRRQMCIFHILTVLCTCRRSSCILLLYFF